MLHKLPLASILIFLGCLLFAFLPDSWIDCLQYDRVAILDGEVWRLWSAHAVHFTFRHALVDTGVLFLAGMIVEREIGARRMASTLVVAAPLISIGLLLAVPDLLRYRGASGIATTMLVFATGLLLTKRSPRAWLLLAAGLAIVGKIGSEALGSPANFSNLPADLVVIWQAHLFGAIFGALTAWNFTECGNGISDCRTLLKIDKNHFPFMGNTILAMPSANSWCYRLPLFLTGLRAALAPVMVFLALYHPAPAAFAVCLVTALLSDIFDGKIARRLGIATPNLRRLDSIADSIFYVAATYCVWVLHPGIIIGNALPLALLAVLEIARYVLDLVKFGKEASYHMWSSKLWGLLLFCGFFAALVFSEAGYPVALAIYGGLVADLEGLIISLILPIWKNDVPTFVHALKLRKKID